ncbi:hypothetical protein ABPG74_003060 [Tetrahymena malaccensis]
MQDTKQNLLEQTILKFKQFLTEDLAIPDNLLNTNQGLQEQLSMISHYQKFINIIGKDQVSNYVSKVIINHFGVKELSEEQHARLSSFIELFLEILL